MWIKICANTNLEDALLAASLGADALGFVFAPSKRRVTPAEVAAITSELPPTVERVGVFHSLDADEIASVVEEAGLTAAQLHGGVDLNLATKLHQRLGGRIKLIQTVHWIVEPGTSSADSVRHQLHQIAAHPGLQHVLIDTKVGNATGGTGVTFPWSEARAVLAEFAPHLNIIIAGGLRPENVAAAIHELRPWGVDVASGVELQPRQKDPARLADFIRIARH
jgi:phosphoribosylanthranilate isomerase